mgnify:CR=1 FL=1
MVTIKTAEEIEILKEGGSRLAVILRELCSMVKPGVSTKEINERARELGSMADDRPAFLDYQPDGARRPFPASVCVSVNDEVVHGIPNEHPYIFKEGDIVTVDMGLVHRGLFTDSAITVAVGKIDESAALLIKITKEALYKGIDAARAGNTVGDIGHAIETFTQSYPFSHAEGLAGHGVGYAVHEDPYVPNTGKKGTGTVLKSGMVIAIEPMLNEGTGRVTLEQDGYTYRTRDGKRSAHFEHTIVITEHDPLIITK